MSDAIGVKASLPHGEFMPWVKANWEFSSASARAYMASAKFPAASNLPDAPATIREAAKP